MNNDNLKVLTNIIGAVESGGQIYGKRNYSAYAGPYTNTSKEHTITIGWAQNYGYEAEKLLNTIYTENPAEFLKLEEGAKPAISSMLNKDWVALKWKPNESQKQAIIRLISSPIGKQCQDKLFADLMKQFINDCAKDYTNNVPAQMMYCKIRHLGGKSAVDRIFKRCKGNYSLDSIMSALKQDQNDTSSSNQVGDKLFWSRHQKCKEFIERYAVSEKGEIMTPLERAKVLLRQPQRDVMTGYTPDGKACFVSAGAWYKTPKKGDIIYFYSESKGRVGHTGIVEKVDESIKYVYTIEGNTSSTQYAENGGCVARHTYSYKNIGGTYRVNGFGRPNFEGAGVTADEFVNMAISQLGYLEKRSNKNLDSKTANAGSNNYQKFQRDVGAGNGDQWCQYFVDAIALYTCQDAPTIELNNVGKGQLWLNTNYGDVITKYCGALLEVDNNYGPKSRNAALAVWKDLMNRKFGSKLTPSNRNFGNTCKEWAHFATICAGETGTFTYIGQFILSANNLYTDAMDGVCGPAMVAAISEYQRLHNLEVDGFCGANTWYNLFN